jgi:hypothetical protein
MCLLIQQFQLVRVLQSLAVQMQQLLPSLRLLHRHQSQRHQSQRHQLQRQLLQRHQLQRQLLSLLRQLLLLQLRSQLMLMSLLL